METGDAAEDSISMVAVSDDGAWSVATPRLPLSVNGAGDATAAIFLAHTLTDGPEAALGRTAASVYAVMEGTTTSAATGRFQLVGAQDQIADPPARFPVTRLR